MEHVVYRERAVDIYLGNCKIAGFEISDRTNVAGAKRPKDQAIYVCVYSVGRVVQDRIGGSLSVEKALDLMREMGIDVKPFIEMIRKTPWSYEVSGDKQASLF